MFGATRGELLLVAFIFALVWSAGALPRLGESLGKKLASRAGGPGRRDGA